MKNEFGRINHGDEMASVVVFWNNNQKVIVVRIKYNNKRIKAKGLIIRSLGSVNKTM